MKVVNSGSGPYVLVSLAEWEGMRRKASQVTLLAGQLSHIGAAMTEVIANVESDDDDGGG